MSFDRPAGLWILALAVPVLLLHVYRGRLRRLSVPMLAFWDQVVIEEDRRSALRRVRHLVSLLLSLGALGLLAAAASGPRIEGWTRAPRRWVIVVDGSPRLSAPGPSGRSRREELYRKAADFVRGRAAGDRVQCPEPRIDWTPDLAGVARRLEGGGRGELDAEARTREALSAGEDVTVVYFGERPPAGARVIAVTDASGGVNSGWTAGRLERAPGLVTLKLEARAFGPGPLSRDEILLFNGKEVSRKRLELVPGAPLQRELRLDSKALPPAALEEGGLAEVALEPADGFPMDDTAAFVVPPLAPPPVVVFHPGKPSDLLMHALETLRKGGLVAAEVATAPVDRWAGLRTRLGEHAVLVFDRVAPHPPPLRGLVLRIGVPGPGAVVDRPKVLDWDREAEPFQRIELGGTAIRRSRIVEEGSASIRAAEGAVAGWTSRGGFAQLELGFSLEESDLAARPSFLLMLANLREAWGAGLLRSYPTQVKVDAPVDPIRLLWIREGELRAIQGDRAQRLAVRGSLPAAPLRFDAGFTRVAAEGRSEWVAANLFDVSMSDPGPAVPAREAPGAEPWLRRLPRGLVLVLGALVLLLAEILLWSRGWV